MRWQEFALCRGSMSNGVSIWFPDRDKYVAARAKAVCAQCPVQQPCYDAGTRETIGVWGGVAVSVHGSRRL